MRKLKAPNSLNSIIDREIVLWLHPSKVNVFLGIYYSYKNCCFITRKLDEYQNCCFITSWYNMLVVFSEPYPINCNNALSISTLEICTDDVIFCFMCFILYQKINGNLDEMKYLSSLLDLLNNTHNLCNKR